MAYPFQKPFVTQLPTIGATRGVGSATGPTAPHVPTQPIAPFSTPTAPSKTFYGPGGGTVPSGTVPGAATGASNKPAGPQGTPWTNPRGVGPSGRAVRYFPGVDTSGSGWARYEDGSFVDYNSAAWRNAAGFQPSQEYQSMWQAFPDSWKADIASWDKPFIDAYLKAIAAGSQGVLYDGQYMSGNDAAKAIRDAAYKNRSNRNKANVANEKASNQARANFPSYSGTQYVPTPFV